MQNKPIIWLAGAECSPGKEREFNEWYNREHMPTALKAPGMLRGTRYERIGSQIEYPRYLAIYEIESEAALAGIMKSDAMAAAREQVRGKDEEGGKGFEYGISVRWIAHYRPIAP